jgi:hypothetical protein
MHPNVVANSVRPPRITNLGYPLNTSTKKGEHCSSLHLPELKKQQYCKKEFKIISIQVKEV